MMTELDSLSSEEHAFLAELEKLPGSYDGPDGRQPEPYGLTAFGEAVGLPPVMRPWIDAPLVVTGTQFLIGSDFDFGELGPLRIASEMSEAKVVTLGSRVHQPDLHVPAGPLSLYTFASYLGYATGHGDAVGEMDRAMRSIADRCRPEAPTEINPAKALAWTLWNRVPLLAAGRPGAGLPALLQRVFARVGKSLSISVGEHPLELVTGGLEGNHAMGDDLLALLLGPEDRELALVREVLTSRVAQVETLDSGTLLADDTPGELPAASMATWFYALWVAAYMAILHGHPPEDSGVYGEVRVAAQEG